MNTGDVQQPEIYIQKCFQLYKGISTNKIVYKLYSTRVCLGRGVEGWGGRGREYLVSAFIHKAMKAPGNY